MPPTPKLLLLLCLTALITSCDRITVPWNGVEANWLPYVLVDDPAATARRVEVTAVTWRV